MTQDVADNASNAPATQRPAAASLGTHGDGATPEADAAVAAPPASNWRDELAGGDERFRKRAERWPSLADVGRSYLALEHKLSSGEYKRALPKDALPDEIAAWRAENGIPQSWEDYEIELGNGMAAGEADRPLLMAFAQFAHERGLSNADANEFATWYFEHQDALVSQREDADADFKLKSEEELRDEMGPDYRRNINVANAMLGAMPGNLAGRLAQGRMADGTKIGNDPGFLRWLIGLGLEMSPTATLVPGGTGDPGNTLDDEIAAIKAYMRTNRSDYAKDEKMQARYRDLLAARDRMTARGRAA
jgi:hypothetical protein